MSRFRGILDTAKNRTPDPTEAPPDPPPAAAGKPTAPTPNPSPAPVETPAPRPVGRPKGKRSDPGFVQVTAYVPADVHHGVKLALLQERKGREFSELVGELLAAWLRSRTAE